MKEIRIITLLAISALIVGISATNYVYADDSSDKDDERKEKMEKDKELKNELKEQHKEKIDQVKQDKKELREEYKKKLEEKKNALSDYRIELKEKYVDLKNEFKEKFNQLRISTISDLDQDDERIKYEIKRDELKLLKLEYREHIKNLKLEAKQHFDEFKIQLKYQETDRKNKIHDKINELKEKYKNQIIQHKHIGSDNLGTYSPDFATKKIELCHVPPGNPENVHTLNVTVVSLRAHLAHGDYIEACEVEDDTNDEGKTIHVGIKDGVGTFEE